ncbi:MCE family protein [Nocardioides sp. Kera G14]|uniref:MCE family protein n=1 Tax=Nocardioides sp. Kera G14 TaxID=2884264 RepID=UPI001D10F04B|nr:MCE family protein [Nocardioides sp. Kera G14]UDY23970.1 MCE family protein [Nocardioides sp. Kera G14]
MGAMRFRALGICFLVLMVAGVWLTYAVFTKKFTSYDELTLRTSTIGLQLPDRADVKIRGVLIGEVLKTSADADGATITLGIKPDQLHTIPANVTGSILPKTLFGEKYVALEIPDDAATEPIRSGTTIARTQVSTELEAVLSDLYPLLRTVQPADLNMTLNAVATALEGRGEQLGDTLQTADNYLKKLNPQLPQLIGDLKQTATVADTYNSVVPQLAQILRDTIVTTGTLKEKQQPVHDLLTNVTSLSNTAKAFLTANESSLTNLARINDGLLANAARYSTEFPCLLGGVDALGVREGEVFRNYTLHIVLETLQKQPRTYTAADQPYFAEDRGPTCGHLPSPNWSQSNPLRVVPNVNDGVKGNVR